MNKESENRNALNEYYDLLSRADLGDGIEI